MRFARRLVLPPLLLLLATCSSTAPLLTVQAITNEVAECGQTKSNCVTATTEEEGDLLTHSATAIRNSKSTETERPCLTGYNNSCCGAEVHGISSYQTDLVCMSRRNDQRDDAKVTDYFQCVVHEFSGTHVAEHVQARLLAVCQRVRGPVRKSVRELLATWKPQQNLDLYRTSLDPDMALLLRRVVLRDRADEATEFYLLAVNDPVIPAGIKEKAFCQPGLMYLASNNLHPNRDETIKYLRRRLLGYPEGELLNKASRHLGQALNVQSCWSPPD